MTVTRSALFGSPRRRGQAFTLIELVVVIVVLAVLSGVAIPRYFNMRDQARLSTAKGNLATIIEAVNQSRMSTIVNGSPAWPATLDLVLETRQGENDINPYRLANQPVYLPDPDNSTTKWHPQIKTVEARMQSQYKGCIWYNNMNGAVRFCVAAQESDAASLTLYNQVNGSSLTGFTQTSH